MYYLLPMNRDHTEDVEAAVKPEELGGVAADL